MTIRVRLHQAADLQLLEQQPGHDRLAGAGVVGQQEADARQLEEVVVDRLELVGQRIDAGDGEGEVGIVLVGQAQAHGLDAQAEPRGVAVERLACRGGLQQGELRRRSGSARGPGRCCRPLPISLTDAPIGTTAMTCTGSGKDRPADDDVRLELVRRA